MLIAELAALGAALCWGLSGLISIGAIRKLGPLAFNRVRMSLVFLMLAGTSSLNWLHGGRVRKKNRPLMPSSPEHPARFRLMFHMPGSVGILL